MFNRNKLIFCIIILFTLYKPLTAQYRFGLTGGVIVANHTGNDFTTTDFPKIGITLGFFFESEINETISMIVEPSFEQKGATYTYEPRFDTKVNTNNDLDYFTLPFMLKANFSKKHSLGAKSRFGKKNRSRRKARYRSSVNYYFTGGIALSFLVSNKTETHVFENDVEIDSGPFTPYSFNKVDASISIGGGIMWKEIFVDLRYIRGIRSIYSGDNVPEIRNHVFSLKLAFSLYHQKNYYGR